MKKVSLLLGALGGALGGYLLSNSKLRASLSEAKDPEEAAKMLGKHLQHDGKKLAKDVQAFIESKEVQANLAKAKKFAVKQASEARKQVESFMKQGQAAATKSAKKGAKSLKKAVGKAQGFSSENIR